MIRRLGRLGVLLLALGAVACSEAHATFIPGHGDGPGLHAALPSSGLMLWLEADFGVTQSGGLVSSVLDRSGNGNTATASGSARPTFDATGANGHPQLTFDGVGTSLDLFGTMSAPAADRTVIIVAKLTSAANNLGIFRFRRAGNYLLFYAGAGGTPYLATNGVSYVIAASSFTTGLRGLVYTTVSSSVGISENGVAKSIASGNPLTITEDGAAGGYVGSNGGANSFFNSSISLVAVYNRILSASDKTIINAYTSPKYGVSVF